MQIARINPQQNILNFGFNDKQKLQHPFIVFEPLLSVPLDTAIAYFSPLDIQGYREMSVYNIPYAEECKMYELYNGHKVLVFQKSGPVIIQTGVKTDDNISQDLKHIIEHCIYNNDNNIENQTFINLQKKLALKIDAGCENSNSLYTLKCCTNNSQDIEKMIKTQAGLLLNTDIKACFDKAKQSVQTEYLTKNAGIENLKDITGDDAQKYYEKVYCNNNMVTAVVSPLPPDTIIKTVSKFFRKPDEKKFVPSKLNKYNISEKDAFDNFCNLISAKNTGKTDDAKIRKIFNSFVFSSNLIDFSIYDILKNGEPYILNYKYNNDILTPFVKNKSFNTSDSIEKYKYSNNLAVLLDYGGCSNAGSKFQYCLKTEVPICAKPGTSEILGCILLLTLEQNPERKNYSINSNISAGNNFLSIDSYCLPEATLQDIKDVKNTIIHLNLSQDIFEKAKLLTKNRFINSQQNTNLEQSKLMDTQEYEYKGSVPLYTETSKAMELYDNVTVNDVKNLYNQILANSEASAIFSVSPELVSGQNKEKLLAEIGSNLPVFKPNNTGQSLINSNFPTVLPDKNYVFKNLTNDENAGIELSYKIPVINNLKEKICLKILETIIGGESYSRLYSYLRDKENLVYSANSQLIDDNLSYSKVALMTKVPVNEGRYENLQKVCDYFKYTINNLKSINISEDELNTAKMTVKGYFKTAMEVPATREIYLSKYGKEGLENICNLIDNITAKDVRKAANTYLKNGIWNFYASKQTFEHNNGYLNKLGNIN